MSSDAEMIQKALDHSTKMLTLEEFAKLNNFNLRPDFLPAPAPSNNAYVCISDDFIASLGFKGTFDQQKQQFLELAKETDTNGLLELDEDEYQEFLKSGKVPSR